MHTIPCGGVEEEGAPLAGEGAPRGRPGGAALPRDLRPLPGELQPQTDITFDYFSDYYFTSRADYWSGDQNLVQSTRTDSWPMSRRSPQANPDSRTPRQCPGVY